MISSSALRVGESRDVVLVDDLTRTQLVMYAGASGDFNPAHTDEVFATQVAGFPSVFAHGMLTMGMTATVLTDWFGDGSLVRFGGRFVKQVWPGDTLTATAVVEAIHRVEDGHLVNLIVNTRNQRGDDVLTCTASVLVRSR